jgi:hypothetical protein
MDEGEAARRNGRRQAKIPLPPKLDVNSGSLPNSWRKFKRLWDSYETVTDQKNDTSEYRTAVFLSCIGPDALDIYDGLSFASDDERNNIDTVIAKFEQYCIGSINETYEAFKFHR